MANRRQLLTSTAAIVGATSSGLWMPAQAQNSKLRIGLMLPYTGTFTQLGVAIDNGFRMALQEAGGKVGGREVEFFKVDDESEPSKGVERHKTPWVDGS